EKQRTRARASWKGTDKAQIAESYKDLPPVEFLRETTEAPVQVARLVSTDKAPVEAILEGKGEVLFLKTPFYAESGGQIGDTGLLLDPETRDSVAIVEDTYRPTPGSTIQKIHVLKPLKIGQALIAQVDRPLRGATMRNHTATHLLHAALRQVLGPQVKQAG